MWRAVTDTSEQDLRPTGDRTIGAPGAHQTKLNRAVRKARPSYPFSQRSWYQALPETVRARPVDHPAVPAARPPRARRTARGRLHHPSPRHRPSANRPATDRHRRRAPLPDEHQAAALWWRLVPHLGPAALDADEHSATCSSPPGAPPWPTSSEPPGPTTYSKAPAWPALVAAVDEACQHHGWTPCDILTTGLAGIPHDGSLTGVEVADALVLRIAMLTDPPIDQPTTPTRHAFPEVAVPPDPDQLPPEDLDQVMAAIYRDQPADPAVPVVHSPTQPSTTT